MSSQEKGEQKAAGIFGKIISQGISAFEPINGLNLEKMTGNLNRETTEEENLRKILAFKKSDEKCLEEHFYSLLNNKK